MLNKDGDKIAEFFVGDLDNPNESIVDGLIFEEMTEAFNYADLHFPGYPVMTRLLNPFTGAVMVTVEVMKTQLGFVHHD